MRGCAVGSFYSVESAFGLILLSHIDDLALIPGNVCLNAELHSKSEPDVCRIRTVDDLMEHEQDF